MVHNFFILSLVFLKLLIVSVAFFLGHPVYALFTVTVNSQSLRTYDYEELFLSFMIKGSLTHLQALQISMRFLL